MSSAGYWMTNYDPFKNPHESSSGWPFAVGKTNSSLAWGKAVYNAAFFFRCFKFEFVKIQKAKTKK